MSQTPAKLKLDLSSALREALDGLLGPEEWERVVADALALADLRDTPTAREDIEAFLAGPLFLALAARTSRARAEEVCLRASSLLGLRRADEPTTEDPISGTQLARVTPKRRAVPRDALASREREVTKPVGVDPAKRGEQAARLVALGARERRAFFIGPDAARVSLGGLLAAQFVRLVTNDTHQSDVAPDLVVIAATHAAGLNLARMSQGRWPETVVLLWCDAIDPTAPSMPGVVTLPLPIDAADEVALIAIARIDAAVT